MNWIVDKLRDGIVDKLRDGRVSLTIKELKYDIDNAASTRRAAILFKAQVYRCQLMSRDDIDIDVFMSPQTCPRNFLMELIGGMENVIFDGEKQVKAAVAHLRTDGIDGGLLKSIMLLNKRAIQVWIATLGAREEQDATVKEIWRKMLESRSSLLASEVADPEDAAQVKLMTDETLSFAPSKYQSASSAARPHPQSEQFHPSDHADYRGGTADYYQVISRAVAALGTSSAELRAALYERARAAQLAELRKREPPISDAESEGERLALNNAIQTVEIDMAISRAFSSKPPADEGKQKKASDAPTFVFTDTEAGRQAFFKLQCKYGDVEIEKGKGMTALVLDPVKIEPDGRQVALLRVVSEDGGFVVTAATPSSKGDRLTPGDFVAWVPHTLVDVPSPDKRLGWLGSIRAKINWMEVGTTGEFKLVCRYD